MSLVETDGIVLRKYNLSDADRIVVVLTEKKGLVRGVAHGAKRLKSKFSGSLEFFSRIRVSYFEKEERELVSIKSADLLESVFGKLSNPAFFDAFAEMADLLIRFTPPNEPNARLFNMTRHCVTAAAEDESSIAAIRVYFEIWLLRLGGFLPAWDLCRECGRNFTDKDVVRLGIDFQIVCMDCKGGLEPLDAGTLGLFRLAQKTSPQKFASRALKAEHELHDLGNILGRLSDAVLERAPVHSIETNKAV